MAFEEFDAEDSGNRSHMRTVFGPGQVDQEIRLAIQYCWMLLPPERQNAEEVEKHIRRIVERALRDLREDADSFGFGGD